MNNNCIEVIGLTYKNIFQDFSVAFEDKKFITISGPNNCGKTTLTRIISNEIATPSSVLIYGIRKEDYRVTDLSNIIRSIIPTEIEFTQLTIEDELFYQLSTDIPKEERQKQVKTIAKKFKITKFLTEPVEKFSDEIKIKAQIAIAVINKPKIILIDDLVPYYTKKELSEIIKIIKQINIENEITIILNTSDLELTIESDYLYIINDSKIIIEGNPIEVLEKDNIINKAGLNLPFMIDLSVKLRDYDLVKNIELNMDRMVDNLWK